MNRRTILCLLLSGALLAAGLVGCLSSTRPERISQLKIGVTVYRQDDTFTTAVRERIEEAARIQETKDNVKITITVLDGKNSQSIQNDHVDKFVAQDYDVICVNEVDRTAASQIVDKARAAGIPLVFFNREPVSEDMQRWNQVYYVGSNPQEAGKMQGQIVIQAFRDNPGIDRSGDGKLQYVMLEGEPNHQDAAVRTEYSIKTVSDAGISLDKLANDTANWQRNEASAKMTQWIDLFGDKIEVVFCNNDEMALGAIDAYQAAEIRELPLIVGIDCTRPGIEAIKAGTLSGTVLNDDLGQGYAIFRIAYALATGQNPADSVPELEGQYAWLPHKIITKDNIDSFR